MAVTATIIKRGKQNNMHTVIAEVSMDNSYASGGEPVTANLFGLNTILQASVPAVVGARLVEYDHANNKIKVFSALGTEIVAAVDLSAMKFRIIVTGL